MSPRLLPVLFLIYAAAMFRKDDDAMGYLLLGFTGLVLLIDWAFDVDRERTARKRETRQK